VAHGEDPGQAARRELAEETGLVPDGELRPFWQGVMPDLTGVASAVEVHVFAGSVDSPDTVAGEGQELAFVPLKDVTSVDLSPTAAAIMSRLLVAA
jgi:8-oxo-dGTP pyrophosphatase MutT (NUDIX family)